mgnify:CR=1 FL=1
MSEYELMRLQRVHRNNARLASLGLLVPMTSTATLSSNLSNRKKCLVSQDNVERRIQPKRNAKQLTSYRDFNDDNDDDSDELDSDTIELDSDTIDSVLLSDEDSDLNDDDDDSHDELDINTNDSDLQSNEEGDEASKKSTILFSNSDSDGSKVFEAAVNNNEEEEEEEEEEVIPVNHPVNHPTDEETSLMMKAFTNKSSTSNVVLPNPALADELISMIKSKFKEGAVTLSLKDPLANMRTKTNMAVFINTWVRSGNELVTRDPNDMGPAANLTRSQVLAAGFRKYGDGVDNMRVCLSYAIAGFFCWRIQI